MRLPRQVPLLFLLMGLATAISSAQEERTLIATHFGETAGVGDASGSALSSPYTFRSEVAEVQIRFQALDAKGFPAPNLQPSDVQVITDGVFSPPIKSFHEAAAAPLLIGFVIDLSESVRPDMQLQEITFSNAVRDIFRPQRDRAFVVAFSSKISLLQPPTGDFSQVQRAIERSPGIQNLTSLYDAVFATCSDQFGVAQGNEQRRVLFLFSDGMDNLSIHSLNDAIEAARKAGVMIDAIAPQDSPAEGLEALQRLTTNTGGHLELLRNKQVPSTLVASLRTFMADDYILSFRPVNQRPGVHSIELKAKSESQITLQAPAEFYVGTTN